MAGRPIVAALAVFLCSDFHAAETQTAFSLADEAVSRIVERCFHVKTAAEVYDGMLVAAHKRSGDENPKSAGLKTLTADQAATAFRSALQALADRPGQRLDILDLAEAGLSDYCRTIDRYCRYFTMQDMARIAQFKRADSIGIGVNLREEGDAIYCHPFPESQAALAGITAGDKLLSVSGNSVTGKPLELVAAWIKGVPGTQVQLRVEKSTGRSQLVTALREAQKMPSVLAERDLTGTVVKIRFFEAGTAAQMLDALKNQPEGRRLTLDLRGCMGGMMNASVEAAQLIMPPGHPVLTFDERGTGRKTFTSTEPKLKPGGITILQDAGTASAAEALIAALVETMPRQVVSRGEQSYGKGVAQDEIFLVGGGLLRLTTGMMFGPSGRSWDGTGLRPSFSDDGSATDIFSPGAPKLSDSAPASQR